jgi:hypothetical protein
MRDSERLARQWQEAQESFRARTIAQVVLNRQARAAEAERTRLAMLTVAEQRQKLERQQPRPEPQPPRDLSFVTPVRQMDPFAADWEGPITSRPFEDTPPRFTLPAPALPHEMDWSEAYPQYRGGA